MTLLTKRSGLGDVPSGVACTVGITTMIGIGTNLAAAIGMTEQPAPGQLV